MEAATRELGMVRIRPFTMQDYDAVPQLLYLCGLAVGGEGRDQMARKLAQDPDLFVVAEVNETIIGMAMGAWDGQRGWVCLLVTDPRFRRMHFGCTLLGELEHRLAARGIRDVMALVPSDDMVAQEVFQLCGYATDRTRVIVSKDISTLAASCPIPESGSEVDEPAGR